MQFNSMINFTYYTKDMLTIKKKLYIEGYSHNDYRNLLLTGDFFPGTVRMPILSFFGVNFNYESS